jgi:hypothetical protein
MGAVASTHSGSHDVGVLVDQPVSSNIMKVGYEHDLIRAFDDVVVYYERPLRRHEGQQLVRILFRPRS